MTFGSGIFLGNMLTNAHACWTKLAECFLKTLGLEDQDLKAQSPGYIIPRRSVGLIDWITKCSHGKLCGKNQAACSGETWIWHVYIIGLFCMFGQSGIECQPQPQFCKVFFRTVFIKLKHVGEDFDCSIKDGCFGKNWVWVSRSIVINSLSWCFSQQSAFWCKQSKQKLLCFRLWFKSSVLDRNLDIKNAEEGVEGTWAWITNCLNTKAFFDLPTCHNSHQSNKNDNRCKTYSVTGWKLSIETLMKSWNWTM